MNCKKYRERLLLGIFALISCSSAPQTQNPADQTAPFFSKQATYVYEGQAAASPDGKKVVTTKLLDDNAPDFPTEVTMKSGHRQFSGSIRFGLNAQILWNPHSDGFAITGSEGGGNGQYQTTVFLLRGNRLEKIPLTSLVRRAFGHPVRCGWPESPNVVAVKWVEPSLRVLLAAQIINHSNCDSFSTFKAYVVELKSRRIIKVYNQIETKALVGRDLGDWLRYTDDECIRRPSACYVRANHPEVGASR